MTDLIVVGGGLSGLAAALAASRAGIKVKVLAKGMGALHWGSGTIDLLGYYPDDDSPIERPLEALRDLAVNDPKHPYARLGGPALIDALQTFVSITTEVGLPYRGAAIEGENLWLPSPVGAARPTFFAPEAQLAGDLGREEPMLIVGFTEMRDFFPKLIAENLTKQGHPARAETLAISLITERRDRGNARLAEALDDRGAQSRLADALARLIVTGERIGLPAILGLADHQAAFNRLRSSLGVPLFEIPTLPSSVPGMRLNSAMRRHLANQGVRVEMNADVINFHADGDRVEYLESEGSGRPLRHRADRFILATGGILGGGIECDHSGRIWEVVLDLPLSRPLERGDWFHSRFFDSGGHPIFRAGVEVNGCFQPVDERGQPVYNNVWAAGCLLAHSDPILERSHEALAIGTGAAAGRFAAS